MQHIIRSTPRNTAEKFTNCGLKEGFQEACSLILRKDLTELVETYEVNIIFSIHADSATETNLKIITRQLRTSIHMVRKELEM